MSTCKITLGLPYLHETDDLQALICVPQEDSYINFEGMHKSYFESIFLRPMELLLLWFLVFQELVFCNNKNFYYYHINRRIIL